MQIKRIQVYVFRIPAERPIRSAVAEYDTRPAVLVRIQDEEGTSGWGEVFCNFPPCGAEHRGRLIDTLLAPLAIGKHIRRPPEMFQQLTSAMEIIAIKSGEYGPFAQCIAGIDIALWDLFARRKGQPLWQLINPDGDPELKVYASGLGPDDFEKMALKRQQEGHRAFKLKVGFGLDTDLENLKKLRNAIGCGATLMADANQIWSYDQAQEAMDAFAAYNLLWIEEPIRASQPIYKWKQLAESTTIDIAAGENLIGEDQFQKIIESDTIKYLQPDIIKWGGISGLISVVNTCLQSGIQYCPHCFGGGIGLIASAHLLASSGANGWLEVDANDNPLQSTLIKPFPAVKAGRIKLTEYDGLGWIPEIEPLEKYMVYQSNAK